MNKNDAELLVKNSLLNSNGTAENRTALSKAFNFPINNCNDFVSAVKQKFQYATIEETTEAIAHNSVLLRLMFSIA